MRNILILFIALTSASYAQRLLKISVDNNGKESTLSYISRSGSAFVSGKEIASLLSANTFYNQEAAKLEIKFPDYTIKLTAKNQFIILTRRSDNTTSIYQLPISTLLIGEDVFLPITYCESYLSLAYGKKINFNNSSKNLTILSEPFSQEQFYVKVAQQIEAETVKSPEADKKPADKSVISKYDLYELSIEDKSNGTLIRLKTSRKLPIPRHSINNKTLYVFFPNVSVSPEILNDVKGAGLVKSVKRVSVSQKNYQLEFLLDEGFSTSEAFMDIESNDIMITIHNKLFTAQNQTGVEVKSKWLFDTIVIDAGHGGKDPGAIGVTGVKEKDINLKIALKLGSLLEKELPGVKVIYTRRTDQFIELYRRGKIANEAGGKLFISIHCNSTVKKNSNHRGFEVYLLRPGKTQDAIEIAEFENSVIKLEDNPDRYQQLTDENFILVSMAHSQYMRYSERFSDLLNQEWKRGTEIPSLGVKQAGFYVLVGASMPSVLIETGFLSNRRDEAYLNSLNGQNDIARSIANSVKKYKDYYDSDVTEGVKN
ncbi:MAG: N-acetylmuramoyl-L-alanine amidase [Melioribacteraceae bacterium]|nr:N-acetylmuramoyl-L-alanine amidase [Melioribacteraceae bacterium]